MINNYKKNNNKKMKDKRDWKTNCKNSSLETRLLETNRCNIGISKMNFS